MPVPSFNPASTVRLLTGPAGVVTVCGLVLASVLSLATGRADESVPLRDGPPATLHETGLYLASDPRVVDPAHLGFAPQYALWTDGASKRRWISIPPGKAIDATDPDAWDFPVGTRFWKEFAFDGRRVETRYMERRADGSWLFATYAWNADGTSASLVPARGLRRAHDFGDGTAHAIPSQADCGICHLSGRSAVLGFGALQLSDDRDPGALHADPAPAPDLRLSGLIARGLITGLDQGVAGTPPSIPAATPTQRTALGYLHGNCGHCHNPFGPLNGLGLFLMQPLDSGHAAAVATTFGVPLTKPPPGLHPGTLYRIAAGDPHLSAIPQRMGSRVPALQMPPLGTARIDAEGLDLINRWIAEARIPRDPDQPNVSN